MMCFSGVAKRWRSYLLFFVLSVLLCALLWKAKTKRGAFSIAVFDNRRKRINENALMWTGPKSLFVFILFRKIKMRNNK